MASYLEMLAEEGVDADDIVSALEAQLDGQGLAASSAAMEALARQLLAGAFKGKGEAAAPAVASTPALLKEAIVCAPAAPARATVAAASSTSSTSSPTSAAASSSATSATTTATTSGAGAPTKGDDKASLASVARAGFDSMTALDDWSSAWEDVVKEGGKWGGRGHGGRGMGRITQLHAGKDVVLEGVTMSFEGHELLTRSSIRLIHGRRYALIGANGCGKTTLLRRMAAYAVPGFPRHLKVHYVEQELLPVQGTQTVVQYLVGVLRSIWAERVLGDDPGAMDAVASLRDVLVQEVARLEAQLEASEGAEDGEEEADRVQDVADRLEDLEERIRLLDAAASADSTADSDDDEATVSGTDADPQSVAMRKEAIGALRTLGFKSAMRNAPASTLSGGWRARLALAEALLHRPDILLLDEPGNHVDLHGVYAMEKFLSGPGLALYGVQTLVLVSHAHAFDSVVTDVLVFEDKRLSHFPGTLSEYSARMQEKSVHTAHMLDAKARKEAHAKKMIAEHSGGGGGSGYVDPKKQKAAKERKKKMERLSWHRSDGKRFATCSLKILDDSALRLPETVEAMARAKPLHFKFPKPLDVGVAMRSVTDNSVPVLTVSEGSVGYPGRPPILSHLTLQVTMGTRVAVVGENGAGKSTLLKALQGDLTFDGSYWKHNHLRVSFVSQQQVEVLKESAGMTALSYFMDKFALPTELKARSHLGSFGLGDAAMQKIGSLSGGQKARLAFACATWCQPHLVLLDEPTNHLSTEGMDALIEGLVNFGGAVVVVSHNERFMTSVCNELWVVRGGTVEVRRPVAPAGAGSLDTPEEVQEAFADLMDLYRDEVMASL